MFLFLLANDRLHRPSASFHQPDFGNNRPAIFQDLIMLHGVLFCRVYFCSCLVYVLLSYVYLLYYVCNAFFFFTLDAGLLARSQYSEGPATSHLNTGFSWFPCVYTQMLRWFPRFQVATTCFSYSPPDLNSAVTNFMFCLHVK